MGGGSPYSWGTEDSQGRLDYRDISLLRACFSAAVESDVLSRQLRVSDFLLQHR